MISWLDLRATSAICKCDCLVCSGEYTCVWDEAWRTRYREPATTFTIPIAHSTHPLRWQGSFDIRSGTAVPLNALCVVLDVLLRWCMYTSQARHEAVRPHCQPILLVCHFIAALGCFIMFSCCAYPSAHAFVWPFFSSDSGVFAAVDNSYIWVQSVKQTASSRSEVLIAAMTYVVVHMGWCRCCLETHNRYVLALQ